MKYFQNHLCLFGYSNVCFHTHYNQWIGWLFQGLIFVLLLVWTSWQKRYFWTDHMISVSFYFCKFDFNDSFTVLTVIVRKQYVLQHQSSKKYGIFQSHPNNSFKLFANFFPASFHSKLVHTYFQPGQPGWNSARAENSPCNQPLRMFWLIISYTLLTSCKKEKQPSTVVYRGRGQGFEVGD